MHEQWCRKDLCIQERWRTRRCILTQQARRNVEGGKRRRAPQRRSCFFAVAHVGRLWTICRLTTSLDRQSVNGMETATCERQHRDVGTVQGWREVVTVPRETPKKKKKISKYQPIDATRLNQLSVLGATHLRVFVPCSSSHNTDADAARSYQTWTCVNAKRTP